MQFNSCCLQVIATPIVSHVYLLLSSILATAKVVKWYKSEGDRVDYKDLICDIETDGATFSISNEDEITAFMGKISVAADSQAIEHGDLLCTVFLAPKGSPTGGKDTEETNGKIAVPSAEADEKTGATSAMEEQAQRLPPGASITVPTKVSEHEGTNSSAVDSKELKQELPPGATMVLASDAASDIDISVFSDLDGKSSKVKGAATITMPEGMSVATPEADSQSNPMDSPEPTASAPVPVSDASVSKGVSPAPEASVSTGVSPAPDAISNDAAASPETSGSEDPAPPVELDRSMFTKEKPIHMPNMGKFQGESLIGFDK